MSDTLFRGAKARGSYSGQTLKQLVTAALEPRAAPAARPRQEQRPALRAVGQLAKANALKPWRGSEDAVAADASSAADDSQLIVDASVWARLSAATMFTTQAVFGFWKRGDRKTAGPACPDSRSPKSAGALRGKRAMLGPRLERRGPSWPCPACSAMN